MKELFEFFQEILCDIDLQKEYNINIVTMKPVEKPKEVETDMMEQEEEVVIAEHPNLEMFNDAVDAVETLLQAVLGLLEQGVQDMEEQDLEEGDEEWEKEFEV